MDLEAVQDKVGRKLLGAIRKVAGEAVVGRCTENEDVWTKSV